MSIASTYNTSRGYAIERIKLIHDLAVGHDYRGIENYSSEDGVEAFVDSFSLDITHIEKWTNSMLEDVLSQPFFRQSIFENYRVVD